MAKGNNADANKDNNDNDNHHNNNALTYRTSQLPPWPTTAVLSIQHALTFVCGVLVVPFILADATCPGSALPEVRSQLISASFVVSGITTILQTTIGLRYFCFAQVDVCPSSLAVVQGPAFAYLPVVLAMQNSPGFECNATVDDMVPTETWQNRIQLLQGSMLAASSIILLLGATGLVGRLTHFLGPITSTSFLLSLVISMSPLAVADMALHWISIVTMVVITGFVLFLGEIETPFPYYSNGKIGLKWMNIFGQFPFLLSIILICAICAILTVTNLEPPGGEARIDRNMSVLVLHDSPWINIPYPFEFGPAKFNLGLFLGYLTSCIAATTENLSEYSATASVSHEKAPPKAAINRGIFVSGIGTMLCSLFGVGSGMTTFGANISIISITKVASRRTLQIAGVLILLLGIFTKIGAILNLIPDPVIGAMTAIILAMIGGIAITNIQSVDIKNSRNVTVIGLSIVIAMLIPPYFKGHPVSTGSENLNQVLNILLSNQMLVAAVMAFFLDNFAPGATRRQRGFIANDDDRTIGNKSDDDSTQDGYAFPMNVQRLLSRIPYIRQFPLLSDIHVDRNA